MDIGALDSFVLTRINLRREYDKSELNEDSVDRDPIVQFQRWLQDAITSELVDEPYAMTIATVDAAGNADARVVLLREVDETDGSFLFFTNYDSSKGQELDGNDSVALVFYWGRLERQIRVRGNAARIDDAKSDAYFASRPHNSKLGAIASHQSEVVSSRQQLDDAITAQQEQYPEGSSVPRPPNWGGYRITPYLFEFWQGRRSRMHDRLRYRRNNDTWIIERLSP